MKQWRSLPRTCKTGNTTPCLQSLRDNSLGVIMRGNEKKRKEKKTKQKEKNTGG
jgi:hypothetical protein